MAALLYKADIARQYGYTPSAWWRRVHANPQCMASLADEGYNRRSRTLTPRQVAVLHAHFGKPDEGDRHNTNN